MDINCNSKVQVGSLFWWTYIVLLAILQSQIVITEPSTTTLLNLILDCAKFANMCPLLTSEF